MTGNVVTLNPDSLLNTDNPCVRNCCLDDSNVCAGCGRKLAEILEWHRADDERRSCIAQSARARLQNGRSG